MKLTGLLVLVPFCFSANLIAKSHNFTINDLLASKKVGAAVVSADGKKVVFSVKTVDVDNNKSESDLWLLDLDTADVKQLTYTPRAESSYQWSINNDAILFSRGKTIWKQPVDGGKATKLKTLLVDIDTLKISADGNTYAFTSRVPVNCTDLQCAVDLFEKTKKKHSTGKVFTRLFVRHWDRWEDGLRSHLFVGQLDSEKIVDVTAGWNADVPSTPFGGSEEYNFSADAKTLYFSSKKQGRKEAWSTNFDVYSYDLLNNSAEPKNLTVSNQAWDTLPLVSNNGKQLAYVAMKEAGYESDKFELMIKDLETGSIKSLTSGWDRSISSMIFSEDDRYLLVTVQNVGNHSIFRIDVKDGKRKLLVSKGKNTALATHGKQIIYSHNDIKSPTELYKLPISGGKPQQLTFFNKPLLSKVKMGDYEQFSFKGWNGEKVYGYMVKPANFKAGKKYPLAFLIHGGPQGSFYNQFHYRWNPQTYAGAGYVSVMIDFHGSTGYGQKFTDSIQADWGGKPLEDLKKGLAAAQKKYSFIDKERACALGASYGGYMINWIASQWNEQFKCLVNHDGVFDNRMMYFATEELWFPEREHHGAYFDYASNYEKHNPVNHVKQWKTPMFVIQGGLDFRIPESQSLGAFTALQRQNIPSKFLYFADENHWVLKPANSIQWHQEVIKWLDSYLKEK